MQFIWIEIPFRNFDYHKKFKKEIKVSETDGPRYQNEKKWINKWIMTAISIQDCIRASIHSSFHLFFVSHMYSICSNRYPTKRIDLVSIVAASNFQLKLKYPPLSIQFRLRLQYCCAQKLIWRKSVDSTLFAMPLNFGTKNFSFLFYLQNTKVWIKYFECDSVTVAPSPSLLINCFQILNRIDLDLSSI